MDNDDLPIGRILTRREALAILGAASAAMLAACAPGQSGAGASSTATAAPATTGGTLSLATGVAQATSAILPTCIVKPEVTEGPYYVDVDLDRSDIRSDPATGVVSEGAPLVLTFNVSQVSDAGCLPLEGARVEIWHCDAAGVYSGVTDPGFDTSVQKFLRGHQVTNANGQATFTTIYPGWYSGRTVHIHFKVWHTADDQGREFTSQLFFDDSFSDQVFTQAPYAQKGQRNTLNSNDNIYDEQLLVNVAPAGQGYSANFDIGLQLS